MTKYDNDFLLKLTCAIDTGLVTYRHYIPWCDALITEESEPPHWLLELTTTKYRADAVKLLSRVAYERFQEHWSPDAYGDFWISCQFLRYIRREISWATFLQEAGEYSDTNGTGWDCEEFFSLLNRYEIGDFSASLEQQQVTYFEEAFIDSIQEASAFYKSFKEWLLKYKE